MRIVHIVTRFLKAGAEENILLSCNGQVKLGHEVHLIYGRDYSADMCDKLDPAVVLHCAPKLVRSIDPSYDIGAYFQLVGALNDINPDVVHTHTSKAGVLGRLAARRVGCPCIIHGVHMLAFSGVSFAQKYAYLLMEKVAAPFTDAFINVGKGTMEECVAHGLGKRDQHYVIPSGMDVRRFRDATPPGDWRALIPPEQVSVINPQFIIFVGSFEERKQQIPFLTMFRDVVRDCPDAVVLLVGEGENETAIREHIRNSGLLGRAVMLGFREDVEQLLALSSVGVLSSLREGLARVVIQYTLAGLPVVCTNTPGVDTIVKEGGNGFLVPVGAIPKMAAPLTRLMNDPALHKRMSDAARTIDLSAWDADNMVREIDAVYRKYSI